MRRLVFGWCRWLLFALGTAGVVAAAGRESGWGGMRCCGFELEWLWP